MNVDKHLDDLTRATESLKARVITSVRDNFALVLLLFNIIVNVALRLFSPHLQNPFNQEFFISFTLNVIATTFAFWSFSAYSEKKTKLTLPGYEANCARWSDISQEVRREKNRAFSDHCKKVCKEERESRRRATFENSTMMEYAVYLERYANKSDELIDKAVESGEITRVEGRAIKKANRQLKLKKIDPLWILCGVQSMDIGDAHSGKIKASTFKVITRPVAMFAMSAFVAALNGTYIGIRTGSEVYAMILSVTSIVIASVAGYWCGANTAKSEHDKVKNRIAFIEQFFEDLKNLPPEEPKKIEELPKIVEEIKFLPEIIDSIPEEKIVEA